ERKCRQSFAPVAPSYCQFPADRQYRKIDHFRRHTGKRCLDNLGIDRLYPSILFIKHAAENVLIVHHRVIIPSQTRPHGSSLVSPAASNVAMSSRSDWMENRSLPKKPPSSIRLSA